MKAQDRALLSSMTMRMVLRFYLALISELSSTLNLRTHSPVRRRCTMCEWPGYVGHYGAGGHAAKRRQMASLPGEVSEGSATTSRRWCSRLASTRRLGVRSAGAAVAVACR